ETFDGSADPSLQALYRGLSRAARRDLHGGRGAEGRVRRLSRFRRHQSAVPLQDQSTRVCLLAGERLHVPGPYARRRRRDHRLDGHRVWRGRPMNTPAEGLPLNRPLVEQPEGFEFTPENLDRAKAHIAKYPPGRQTSAVLPLLYTAQ